jgi:phospholipid-transporting ATPase
MQTINEITLSNGQPTIYLPLTVVIIVSAMKDLFEDRKRHAAD